MSTTAPREEDIDYMCDNCGKIKKGPHEGEFVPAEGRERLTEYKGAPISNGMCDDCAKKWVTESKQAQQTHPYWRTRTKPRPEKQ